MKITRQKFFLCVLVPLWPIFPVYPGWDFRIRILDQMYRDALSINKIR
ncbi:hypothetical protein D1AOALGA4SA_12097 [Olavius algarvensis Delta 1 endosymbiont]|nr:hypothetical protein D1AOALGA4SA_12097 [Olavius algarvensis Delta 1 endosymbiont]